MITEVDKKIHTEATDNLSFNKNGSYGKTKNEFISNHLRDSSATVNMETRDELLNMKLRIKKLKQKENELPILYLEVLK